MISYPSIPSYKSAPTGLPCYAFYKYDGSNLRWEWSPKQGWHKFGTRTRLMDLSDTQFGPAIPLFLETLAPYCEEIIIKNFGKKIQRAVIFTEYFGPHSFAGWHDPDDTKELRIIDMCVFKKGFLTPKEFIEMFKYCPNVAELVYRGNLNQTLIDEVQNGSINGRSLEEGIVCKADTWTAKVKTKAWLERLKDKFKDDWEKYV